MSYTYATGKSESDLVSYQSVRGADVKAINEAISDVTPLSQLYADFGRPDKESLKTDSVDETIKFLQATDFLKKPTDRSVAPIESQPYSDLPFELQMFHHLMQQRGEQEHFMDLHRVLVEKDTAFMGKDELEEELERELDQYALDWNVQKVKMWYDLVAPLGLVSVHDNQEILTSPAPRVVYDLLAEFTKSNDSSRIREAFDWIEKDFFFCYAKRGGARPRVHRGLSDTLATLVYDGALEFDVTSDTTSDVVIPSTEANKTSTFTLHERPNTPAYEYPLYNHTMEISQ